MAAAATGTTTIYDSQDPIDGARATESAHRKIELQSPADLTYLIANVSRAAREKLDKHFPPDAAAGGTGEEEEEDVMRTRVAQLVDDYIRDTFTAAKDSISINGMDTREMEAELAKTHEGEELEPFDTKLLHRIAALSSQIEQHTLELATLRRTAPQETARRFRTTFERQAARDDARLRADRDARLHAATAAAAQLDLLPREQGEGEGDRPPPPLLARVDEMQNTYSQGTGDLARLKRGLPDTVGRMEKARRAVEALEER